jgi:mono/diheme cytochrome c family protein
MVRRLLALGCLLAALTTTAENRRLEVGSRWQQSAEASRYLRQATLFSRGEGIHSGPVFWEGIQQAFRAAAYVPGVEPAAARMARHRWGFIEVDGQLEGISPGTHAGASLAIVRCIVCHGGRAAGRFYPGLGNKNFDVWQVGHDGARVMEWWSSWPALRASHPNTERDRLAASALKLYRLLGEDRLGNLTQGLVPVSLVRTWFYRAAGRPVPDSMPRQQVKVPAFWGYGAKAEVGAFADGFGDATHAAWAAMVEVTAGQSPETVLANYAQLERIEEEIARILPPRFPFAIDTRRAAAGEATYLEHCASCHGTYQRDDTGAPILEPPTFTPWRLVGTDPDRIAAFDPSFNALVDANPLRSVLRRGPLTEQVPGYIAPRLDGIWARFPYLHNGSVPTLDALLRPHALRPRAFPLRDAGEAYRFDPVDVGLTLPPRGSIEEAGVVRGGIRGARDVFDAGRVGHGNGGHEFGTTLDAARRRALIEYLKTL